MRNVQHSFDQRQSAAAVFLAGLPDHHRGRVLTSGSVIDSWRRKPAAIRDRLARERIAHAWRAPL